MEVFRAVMLSGTVKGAGELMHISQPAASKLLAQAERHAGLPLFARIRGRLVPTQNAHQLLPEIEAVWRTMEKARSFARDLGEARGESLRIASTARFCTWLVPCSAVALYEQHPDIQLHVDMVMPRLVTDAVVREISDIGIVMMPTEHPELEIVRSLSCGMVCVIPNAHRLAAKRIVKAADLQGERLIAISQAPPFGHLLEQMYSDLLKGIRIDVEVTSSTTACWFVQAGAGVAIVDAATAACGVFKDLTARPFVPSPNLPVQLLRAKNRPLSPAAKAFCDALCELWERAGLSGKGQAKA